MSRSTYDISSHMLHRSCFQVLGDQVCEDPADSNQAEPGGDMVYTVFQRVGMKLETFIRTRLQDQERSQPYNLHITQMFDGLSTWSANSQ